MRSQKTPKDDSRVLSSVAGVVVRYQLRLSVNASAWCSQPFRNQSLFATCSLSLSLLSASTAAPQLPLRRDWSAQLSACRTIVRQDSATRYADTGAHP